MCSLHVCAVHAASQTNHPLRELSSQKERLTPVKKDFPLVCGLMKMRTKCLMERRNPFDQTQNSIILKNFLSDRLFILLFFLLVFPLSPLPLFLLRVSWFLWHPLYC